MVVVKRKYMKAVVSVYLSCFFRSKCVSILSIWKKYFVVWMC